MTLSSHEKSSPSGLSRPLRVIPVHPEYQAAIRDDPAKSEAITRAATSFREFLRYWYFVDSRTGEVRLLGEELWPGQEDFVQAMSNDEFIYALKARKLGFTTLEVAYDGWVVRFRDRNARVHLFSRRQDAAQELLGAVYFGLKRLPSYMTLPVVTKTKSEIKFDAGAYPPNGDVNAPFAEWLPDERMVKAYPADEETAVEATCTHGHVDEWARMGNPRKVWQAIEATMAGSCHVITTGMGPQNYSGQYWLRALKGDTRFNPFFVGALNRPDRDKKWLASKKKEMDELEFRREYAMRWEDALYGGGEFVFNPKWLDVATDETRGPTKARKGRKYIKAWDIGRHQDSAVGIVLDVTDTVVDVVAYFRYKGLEYPMLQRKIEAVHGSYPGYTVIEDNAAGEAVRENLTLPPRQVIGFKTTPNSKARIIEGLKIGFQQQVIRYDADAWPQLDTELRGYMLPDDQIVQDSVMTLAIGYDTAPKAHSYGKLGSVITW